MRRGVAGLALSVALVPATAAAADPLATVPAMRSWAPSKGSFELGRSARVVIRQAERKALLGEARTLAADLGDLLGRRVRTASRARRGDVLLTLTSRDRGLGDEGYSLRIGRVFTIAAHAPAGVFYGGRTLLQLRRLDGSIPRGRARDLPRYRERGLMLDNGRAFFSRAWLEHRIRDLSDLKLNLFHLHFSDDQGFRIESKAHPEIVTQPALTQDDVRALVALARKRHVTIVPEIDMPGHMTAILAHHPEFQLANAAGQKQPDKLDVSNEAARRFASELIAEFMPLFPGPWWHMGADEYLGAFSTDADYSQYPQLEAYARGKHGESADGKDAVLDFVNSVDAQVNAAGRTLRIWSDGMKGGSAVALPPRIAVEWWENRSSFTPAELIAQGHRVLNVGWWPLYYVTGGPLKGLRSNETAFYEDWQANHFEGPYTTRWFGGPPQFSELAPGDPLQLGTAMAVWNDDPASPDAQAGAIAQGVAPRLRIVAQKAWASPEFTDSYAKFAPAAARATGPLSP